MCFDKYREYLLLKRNMAEELIELLLQESPRPQQIHLNTSESAVTSASGLYVQNNMLS